MTQKWPPRAYGYAIHGGRLSEDSTAVRPQLLLLDGAVAELENIGKIFGIDRVSNLFVKDMGSSILCWLSISLKTVFSVVGPGLL